MNTSTNFINKANKKSNKKFTFSGALVLILALFVMFFTTGCQKQQWGNRTVWNIGIVGDYNNAVSSSTKRRTPAIL